MKRLRDEDVFVFVINTPPSSDEWMDDDLETKDFSTKSIKREDRVALSTFSLPNEMILELFFWMDKHSLFNFIQCNRHIYQLFDAVMATSLNQIRLNYLNKEVKHVLKRQIPPRLIEMFSNRVNNKNVMLTYDDYFRQKSASTWPSTYFYSADNHKQTIISKEDAKELLKNQDKEITKSITTPPTPYSSKEEIFCSEEEMLQTMVFPYGMFPQKDTYDLTFNDYVKRKIRFKHQNEPTLFEMDRSKKEFVITETIYDPIEEVDCHVDYHFYTDSMNRILKTPFCERIVRFFKHPHEMTLQDFDHRFKNDILKEIAKILIYDCAFEHNKTTPTRERFVVAGGSILHALTGCGCGDIDIFVMCNGEDEKTTVSQAVKSVLSKFEKLSQHLTYNIMKSRTTINICSPENEIDHQYQVSIDNHCNIQIVLLKFETIEELLVFFDLDCCRFAYDGFSLYTLLEGLRSLKYKLNILPLETSNGEINLKRAIKYGKRGFFTLSLPTHHPLSHEMHNDFIVEKIRSEIVQEYSKHYLEIGLFSHPYIPKRILNPCERYFVHPCFHPFLSHNIGIQSVDLDESCYLYPIVLRNASYPLIDFCRKYGLEMALRILMPCLERSNGRYLIDASQIHPSSISLNDRLIMRISEKHDLLHERIHEILHHDEYLFVEKPNELFSSSTLKNQDHSIVLSNRYSDQHLQRKYRILKCKQCGTYEYSPSKCALLEEEEYQNDLEFWKLAREHPEVVKLASCEGSKSFHKNDSEEEETHSNPYTEYDAQGVDPSIDWNTEDVFIARRDYEPTKHFLCKSCDKELKEEIAKEMENLPCHAEGVLF
ncbi:hypothetical protein FDP41_007272 [Naegleria fowleri]|uniref:F-box domain-containing protein n=1 Tax=Naegleria fowleri TaxID=5763 RepID=A0A6A5BJQ2_NAEFO|nr:uncharacterized protein FDP41_007272 [Naegleria fowleri]KAF0973885.1 hypothetical protein FDP41_007272 [Naegleria fowleri]